MFERSAGGILSKPPMRRRSTAGALLAYWGRHMAVAAQGLRSLAILAVTLVLPTFLVLLLVHGIIRLFQ